MNDTLAYLLIGAPLIVIILIGVFEAGGWLRQLEHIKLYGHPAPDVKVAAVAIQPKPVVGLWTHFKRFIKGANMSRAVIEGQTDALMIVATNAAGRVLLPLDTSAAVALSMTTDSVGAIDLTTGNFTFTAGSVDGPDSLVATVSGVSSQPFVEVVTPDNTVAAVVIQPQAPAAPAAPAA